jgi:acyl-CoA thioesterase I
MTMGSGEPANDGGEVRLSMSPSYGSFGSAVEGFGARFRISVMAGVLGALMAIAGMVAAGPVLAQGTPTTTPDVARPIKLAVLGDSLTAGFGLSAAAAFPVRLQKSLKDNGIDVDALNAGVSGDTSSGGRDRLDWSIPDGTQAVIVELGANDALRGLDPAITRAALDDIIKKLQARGIAVMLCGMYAPRNFGPDYVAKFDPIYPELAKTYGVPLYPFFLDGVAGDPKLTQPDGLHPTAEGVDVIVKRILPTVQAFLGAITSKAAASKD